MGGGPLRAAQGVGLAAVVAALGLPAAANAIAPGGPVDEALPTIDRSAAPAGTAVAPARVREARSALRRRFGRQLVVGVDPDTGRTRVVQRLDGALTAPASGDRRTVARSWVRANRAVLGLDAPAVDDLVVADTETSGRAGLTTVRLAQRFRGIEVFDGGVEVTLDRGGRVLAATGEPVPDPEVASVEPRLDAEAARDALDADVGPTEPEAPAALTLFPVGDDIRLGWRLIQRASSVATYSAVVDARSGEVLFRQNLTKSAAPANIPANVFPNYPVHPFLQSSSPGPTPVQQANALQRIDLAPWLVPGATTLSGPYARTFSDVDDNDQPNAAEEVDPSSVGELTFSPKSGPFCPDTDPGDPMCTWTPGTDNWRENQERNAVQAFALVNRFREHLASPPINFGASGEEGFAGTDRVIVHARDGAAIRDADHINNANMTVLPEGSSPTMQMYLFRGPAHRAIDGGDDAATVWHEYTHGLSGRLVAHADGTSALSSVHAGALGEGWSDFYALDKLHRDGLEVDDTDVDGEVDIGAYSDAEPHATRSQGADCPVGAAADDCPGTSGAGTGGYTLGDLGRIADGPEVHYDGEIWLETLWDLRQALVTQLGEAAGSELVQQLVTDGMRATPPEPSFIDARNAILAADIARGGDDASRELIWNVFAARGMGYFASVENANDAAPVESFAEPGDPAPSGTVTGRIVDDASRMPMAGVRVSQPVPSLDGPTAVTGSDGRFSLTLPSGTEPSRLTLTGPDGYDRISALVMIPPGGTVTLDRSLSRDWASAAGGARQDPAPSSLEYCGPDLLLDEADGSGWSAVGTGSVTIRLPEVIDVSAIGFDPGATCGDGPEAAVSALKVEGIRENGTVVTMLDGNGGSFDASRDGELTLREPRNRRGVTKIRVTLLESRDPGSSYIDLSALSVYGSRPPRGTLSVTPAAVDPGTNVAFDASSFSDPDSAIAGYDWDFDGDGSTDQETNGPRTTFAYDTPGARTARVTVRDVSGAAGEATATVRVNDPTPPVEPTTTGTTTTTPPPPPPPTLTVPPPVIPPTVAAKTPTLRLAATKSRRATAVVKCASRCTVRAKATVSRSMARRLRRSQRTVIALNRTVTKTSTTTLTLPLSSATRSAMKRRRVTWMSVALEVRVVDASGRSVTRRATFRLAG